MAMSYLRDIHIESCSSDYNPDMQVLLSRGRYQLVTAKAIYSHEDLYSNFSKILVDTIDLSKADVRKVLVLGLGLGSIPIILDQIDEGGFEITAVEIDEVVCELAAEYAYPMIQSPIHTVIADAYQYVMDCTEEYDLICVDLFLGDTTPPKFRSKQFLERLGDLTSTGAVLYNTIAYTDQDKKRSKGFYLDVFKDIFPDSEMVYAHKNYMLISHSRWFR
jgi:spermidine synthase